MTIEDLEYHDCEGNKSEGEHPNVLLDSLHQEMGSLDNDHLEDLLCSPREETFLAEPLCVWANDCLAVNGIKSPRFSQQTLTYMALCNGIPLNNIILYIDSRPTRPDVCHFVRDFHTRLRNLGTLLANIQSFYKDVLHQLIIMPLPDLLTIARHPHPEESGSEMKKILLLLLGCAVQSDRKEEFINRIKNLNVTIQQALAAEIQKVTGAGGCVYNVEALELDAEDSETVNILGQLQRLVKERDGYAQTLFDLAQEHESSDTSSTKSSSNGDLCGPGAAPHKLPESQQHDALAAASGDASSFNEKRHLGVELAETKAKLRRTRQEFEEKLELLAEYKDELIEKDSLLSKLRQENLELLKDARSAKMYRDEVDILREKASKVDRLESESARYKEKLSELDFFKSRVEELRSENHVLLETRNLLEDQLESSRKRVEDNCQAESQLLQAQKTVHQLQDELKCERQLISDLMEQNSKLEQEHRNVLGKSNVLEQELDDIRHSPDRVPTSSISLSDQLSDSVQNRLLRLELENETLKSKLHAVSGSGSERGSSVESSSAATTTASSFASSGSVATTTSSTVHPNRLAELTAEIDLLTSKLKYAEEKCLKDSSLSLNLQEAHSQLAQEKQTLEAKLCAVEQSSKFELEKAKQEKEILSQEIEVLSQSRSTSSADSLNLRRELETLRLESGKLSEQLRAKTEDLAANEDRLTLSEKQRHEQGSKVGKLERENRCLERENSRLKELLETGDSDLEKHRTTILELERENQRLEALYGRCSEASAKLTDLEVERRHLAQQLSVESKKSLALREDLIAEKTRTQSLQTQMQSVANWLGVENSEKNWDYLEGAIQESLHRLRSDHASEIAMLKNNVSTLERDLEGTKKDLELLQSNPINAYRLEHSEKTNKEANERIADLERRNAGLHEEIKHAREQVRIMQDQARRLQAQTQTLTLENSGLKHELADLKAVESKQNSLQSENAKLQVEGRTTQLQLEVLEQDNTELRKQLGRLEQDYEALGKSFEKVQQSHAELSADHETLQNLHLHLNRDYEVMTTELGEYKATNRQLRLDYHAQVEQNDLLARQRDEFGREKNRLEVDRASWEGDLKNMANLQSEHGALKRENDDLKVKYLAVQNELRALKLENRNLKSDQNGFNYRMTQVHSTMGECQERLHERELELVKLEHKCDMLQQLNSTLEDENRTLLRQLDMVVAQNQDLLNQALLDKDHFHSEEKELQEKLNQIRRQKEKLEEKIMDQFKLISPAKGRKGNSLVKRAKALLSKTGDPKSASGTNSSLRKTDGEEVLSSDEASGFSRTLSAPGSSSGDFRPLSTDSCNSSCTTTSSSLSEATFSRTEKHRWTLSTPRRPVSAKRAPGPALGRLDRGRRPSGASSDNEAYKLCDSRTSGSNSDNQLPTVAGSALSNTNVIVTDRISLSGSERGVDVPEDPINLGTDTSDVKSGVPSSMHSSPARSHSLLPTPSPPIVPPPRGSLRYPSPPPLPQRYPNPAGMSQSQQFRPVIKLVQNGPRPPLPAYHMRVYGPPKLLPRQNRTPSCPPPVVHHRPPPPPYHHSNSGFNSPQVIRRPPNGDEALRNGSELPNQQRFSDQSPGPPTQTSTPKSDTESKERPGNRVSLSPDFLHHPGNNSAASPDKSSGSSVMGIPAMTTMGGRNGPQRLSMRTNGGSGAPNFVRLRNQSPGNFGGSERGSMRSNQSNGRPMTVTPVVFYENGSSGLQGAGNNNKSQKLIQNSAGQVVVPAGSFEDRGSLVPQTCSGSEASSIPGTVQHSSEKVDKKSLWYEYGCV